MNQSASSTTRAHDVPAEERFERRLAHTLQAPALVAISHGTSSPSGQVAVASLLAAVGESRPDLQVSGGFVDVQQPDVAATLAAVADAAPAVVVPLLLSAGFHVHVDLVNEVRGAVGRSTALSAALGPDDRLVTVLVRRLREAGLRAGDEVVMAAAGSTDARAVADCLETGRLLADRLGRAVTVGFISAARPSLERAVLMARQRTPGARVVVATYLLAPGYFADSAAHLGDVVSAPLLAVGEAPPPELVQLVVDRYRELSAFAPLF